MLKSSKMVQQLKITKNLVPSWYKIDLLNKFLNKQLYKIFDLLQHSNCFVLDLDQKIPRMINIFNEVGIWTVRLCLRVSRRVAVTASDPDRRQ